MGNYSMRVLEKIIVLFIVMIAGYIIKKVKICDAKSTKALSGILATITNPCLIISSLQTECTETKLRLAFQILALSLVIHTVMAVASHFIFKSIKDVRRRAVYSFALTYMNCGFMGYPIMMAIFGDENGLFYGVIYTVIFNLFSWSHGVCVMCSGQNAGIPWKKLLNPGLLSVIAGFILFVSGIRFPAVVNEGLEMIGDMTFPLSMIIIGCLLADIKFKDIFKDASLYLFSLLKLLAVPAVMLAAAYFLKLPQTLGIIGVTMCATPAATNTAVLAEVYGGDSGLAAKLVGMSTLLCLITMPFMLMITQNII